MLESVYQSKLIKKIKRLLPGCLILKNDTDYIQGIPDLLILFENKWAMLEVKASASAPNQPNQEWYVCELDEMSFAAFIYPDIEEEVLDALQQTLRVSGSSRISKR